MQNKAKQNIAILFILCVLVFSISLVLLSVDQKAGHAINPNHEVSTLPKYNEHETSPLESGSYQVRETSYIRAGTLLATKSDDEQWLSYYVQDHLGSNLKVINNIVEVQRNRYYAFGETTTTGESENDYKYTGKELDDENGLYYYGARYYKPKLGRFMQADSLSGSVEDPLSLNKYIYTRNNPLKYIDPTGNEEKGVDYYSQKYPYMAWGTGMDDQMISFVQGLESGEIIKEEELESAMLQIDDAVDIFSLGTTKLLKEGALIVGGILIKEIAENKASKEATEYLGEELIEKFGKDVADTKVVKTLTDVESGKIVVVPKDVEHIDMTANILGVTKKEIYENPDIAKNIVGGNIFVKNGEITGLQVGGSGLKLGAGVKYSPEALKSANNIMSLFVYSGGIKVSKEIRHQVISP